MVPRRTHLSADERRTITVKTVINLCAQDDPARITTSKIARQMKVTQGALFRHFPNKDAIWEAVIGWVAESLMQRLDAAAGEAGGPLPILRSMFLAHIAFIGEHPGVPRLLLGQLQQPRSTPARRMVQSLMTRYRERVEKLLLEARSRGELDPDVDIEVAATQYIGMVQGLVVQSLLTGNRPQVARQAPRAFDLFCRGLCSISGAKP